MMLALLAKELRALRPYAFCIAAMLLLSVIYLFATELPDRQLLVPAAWLKEDRMSWFITLVLFALLIGAGLLINESEEGTLGFLDGLPLSRSRLFVAKTLAGWLTLALVSWLGLPMDLLLDWFSRSSVDGPFPWKFFGAQIGLQALCAACLLALAMAFSFVRHWFALVVGLLFWGFLWLRQSGVPLVGFFDPSELLDVGLDEGRVLVPWTHVAAQAGMTVALLGIAWAAFLSLGDRAEFAAQQLGKWRVLHGLGVGLRWLAPLVWIGAMVQIMRTIDPPHEADPAMPVGEAAFARQETIHYEFLFRSAQREQAAPLLAVADAVFDSVSDFLAAAPPPSRFVVDLASPVVPHAAGQTNWTKIRLPIYPGQTLDEQRLILGHETAHVFIEQLSDGHLSGHFRYARFLHEGLATHVDQELFTEPGERVQNRRSVAAAWARGRVPFELLADDSKLSGKRDPNLAYPLGEVFARALIDSHGREAPAKLLRAFARKKAPRGLAGNALWRDTMQAAGLSLDRVIAGYESACATIAEEEKAFVEKLPRVTATVAVEGGEIVIRPKFEGTAPGELICMIDAEDPLKMETPEVPRRPDGSFALPRERLSKPTLRYLLGWRTAETRLPVFEPWAEAAL